MAFTLACHIILVPLGVSWALMVLLANYRVLERDDAAALELAQRWSKYMAVTFAVGAVSGTVLSCRRGLVVGTAPSIAHGCADPRDGGRRLRRPCLGGGQWDECSRRP